MVAGDCSEADPEGVLRVMHASPDLLIHECTFCSGKEDLARERGHSTPSMVGEFVASLGPAKVALTHFSRRYDEEAVEEIRTDVVAFVRTTEVIAAKDFMIVNV